MENQKEIKNIYVKNVDATSYKETDERIKKSSQGKQSI